MNRYEKWVALTVVLGMATLAWSETDPKKRMAEQRAKGQQEAKVFFQEVLTDYLGSNLDGLNDKINKGRKHTRFMTRENRSDLNYIKKMVGQHRPKWWKKCDNSSAVSFKARIWNKKFMANYYPTRAVGFQAARLYRGKLQVLVSWRPNMVGSTRPLEGNLCKSHGFKEGDIAEAIVWHELGHNYVTTSLPLKHVIKLYNEHQMLFSHLQEFYADLTSLSHSSPQARLMAMMMRVPSLLHYSSDEEHTRAAHAIGSVVLMHMLREPDKWPSVRFPAEVPKEKAELNTIIYVYKHISPEWTLAEDRQLRTMIKDFTKKYGEKALRTKGRVYLPEKTLYFQLMAAEDRSMQKKRDEWVAGKLKELIKSGRADKKSSEEVEDQELWILIKQLIDGATG